MSLLERVQKKSQEPTSGQPEKPAAQAPTAPEAAAPAPRERDPSPPKPAAPSRIAQAASAGGRPGGMSREWVAIKAKVHARLLDELDTEVDVTNREQVSVKIGEILNEHLASSQHQMTRAERQRVVESILNDALGLGPLEALLSDPDVTEIMINGPQQIYIEQGGRLTLSNVRFEDSSQLMRVIDRVVSSIGRRVDESSPMVDARLKDGSRVNVIIPPLALKGPTMTIRKFATDPFTLENLVQFDSLTEDMASFLNACVRSRLNVVVSGGTGSGKTTTLNVLSSFIPEDERIVTIEDAAELQLRQEHVVTLETRPANVEGKGRIGIRELVINSLRMRPDRIVVGECRGGEALDMLQAMNTGHDGSLTTLHSNSPKDAIGRLETMVLMAGAELPSRAIREQIASAVNLIVQQTRLRDGRRKIVNITEVRGIEGDQLDIADIFIFKQTGVAADGTVEGYHTPTGYVPTFLEVLSSSGEDISPDTFTPVRRPVG